MRILHRTRDVATGSGNAAIAPAEYLVTLIDVGTAG
jgi:hypothetical protein